LTVVDLSMPHARRPIDAMVRPSLGMVRLGMAKRPWARAVQRDLETTGAASRSPTESARSSPALTSGPAGRRACILGGAKTAKRTPRTVRSATVRPYFADYANKPSLTTVAPNLPGHTKVAASLGADNCGKGSRTIVGQVNAESVTGPLTPGRTTLPATLCIKKWLYVWLAIASPHRIISLFAITSLSLSRAAAGLPMPMWMILNVMADDD
jgi:hypothetical protein